MQNQRWTPILTILAGFVWLGLFPAGNAFSQNAEATTGSTATLDSISADVDREATLTMPPFTPYQVALVHIHEVYSGSMGSIFTYTPSNILPVLNLTYSANSGASCAHDAGLMITCTGVISQVTIDYDWQYLVNDYDSGCLLLGYGGNSNYALDFTIHLIYPAPLSYLYAFNGNYTAPPISVTSTEITWFQADATVFQGYGLFKDPRIALVFLPLVIR